MRRQIAPGPKGFELARTALRLKTDFLGTIGGLQQKYGDTVRIKIPGRELYFVFNPDDGKHVTRDNHRNYVKNQEAYKEFYPLMGNGMVLTSGDEWVKMRRIVQAEFIGPRVRSHFPIILKDTKASIERWQVPATGETKIDLFSEMHRLALICTGKTLFGANLEKEVLEIGEVVGFYTAYILQRLAAPFRLPRWVPTKSERKAKAIEKRTDEIFYDLLKDGKTEVDQNNVLTRLLAAVDPKTGEKLTAKDVRDQVLILLLAGHETTANLLCWTIFQLCLNPEALGRVLKEQDEIVGSGEVEPDHVDQFRYLSAVLKESVRLYPPAPLISRTSVGDDKLGGFDVPAGSVVLFPFYHTQRDTRFWKDPLDFKPERFIEPDPQVPFSYFPFGKGGARSCIGEEMAMFETKLVLSELLRKLNFRYDPNHKLKLTVVVNMKPSNGLPMLVSRR